MSIANTVPTEQQLNFLDSLSASKDAPTLVAQVAILRETGAMTRTMASGFITKLIAAPDKPLATVEFGYYKSADGTFYSYQEHDTHYGKMPVFAKLVLPSAWAGAGAKARWRKLARGPSSSKKYAAKYLSGLAPLTLEQAKAEGKLLGRCIRCGATLTDPVSVANGIGPVCQKYVGWM